MKNPITKKIKSLDAKATKILAKNSIGSDCSGMTQAFLDSKQGAQWRAVRAQIRELQVKL